MSLVEVSQLRADGNKPAGIGGNPRDIERSSGTRSVTVPIVSDGVPAMSDRHSTALSFALWKDAKRFF